MPSKPKPLRLIIKSILGSVISHFHRPSHVPFPPIFSVQILNERNEIFTIEDDPYMGLSVLSCVREAENEQGSKKKAIIEVLDKIEALAILRTFASAKKITK